jgi:CHAD domain-containing protein
MTSTEEPEQPAPTFRAYGASVIRDALDRMLSHLDGVREGTDIEAVHDMRVASRRLRAAISVFGPAFEGKAFGRFEREVKAVTKALGAARDLDVMIDALEKMESGLPPAEQSGIDHFIQTRREERRDLQKEVVEALDRVEERDLPARFARIVEKLAPDRNSPAVVDVGGERDGSDAPAGASAPGIVQARVVELLSWEPFIRDAARVEELHAMRIAAKRLRYTMELFAPFHGPELRAAIGQVKRVQELLGDIHDADVLVPALADYLRRLLAREVRPRHHAAVMGVHAVDLEAARGLLNLCRGRRDHRDATYAEFLNVWTNMRAEGFFDRLWTILNASDGRPPAEAPSKRGAKRAAPPQGDST